MKLYARNVCPYCRRITSYLEERNIEIDVVAFDPEKHDKALSALNPKKTVPTLDAEEGLAIFESFVIIQYFEEIRPEGCLTPTLPAQRARMRLLYDLADNRLGEPMRQFVRAPADDPARDDLARTLAALAVDALPLLSTEGPFALGADLSVADFSLPPLLFRAMEAGLVANTLPKRVQSWCQTMLARPSMRQRFPKIVLE